VQVGANEKRTPLDTESRSAMGKTIAIHPCGCGRVTKYGGGLGNKNLVIKFAKKELIGCGASRKEKGVGVSVIQKEIMRKGEQTFIFKKKAFPLAVKICRRGMTAIDGIREKKN